MARGEQAWSFTHPPRVSSPGECTAGPRLLWPESRKGRMDANAQLRALLNLSGASQSGPGEDVNSSGLPPSLAALSLGATPQPLPAMALPGMPLPAGSMAMPPALPMRGAFDCATLEARACASQPMHHDPFASMGAMPQAQAGVPPGLNLGAAPAAPPGSDPM